MSHILRTNGLLKHVIEERIEGKGRRRRRHKKLLDDLKETEYAVISFEKII
jgi:hypothetical protein